MNGYDVTSDFWTQGDIDTYVEHFKQQIGGGWFRIVQDPETRKWSVDRSAPNRRYDSTSSTLSRITGFLTANLDHDDLGALLPAGVVTGVAAQNWRGCHQPPFVPSGR